MPIDPTAPDPWLVEAQGIVEASLDAGWRWQPFITNAIARALRMAAESSKAPLPDAVRADLKQAASFMQATAEHRTEHTVNCICDRIARLDAATGGKQ